MNAVQRPFTCQDLEIVDRLPSGKSRDQPSQSEDVVEMTMCDQDAIETPEPDSRPQNLSLGALATINQESLVAVGQDLSGKAPVD